MSGTVFTSRPAPDVGITRHARRATFQSPWADYPDRIGQRFTITGMQWDTGEGTGLNPEPKFYVRFEDGTEELAHAEEIFEGWAEEI